MQRFTKTRAVKLPTRAMLTLATLIGLLLNIVAPALPGVQTPTASAHNLNASAVYVYFDPDTQTFLDARINGGWTPGTPLLQAGDELGLIIKAVPDLGTNTGVGGYTTFYVPNGLQVLDAAFVQPGSNPADGISGYDKIPAKGQALMPAVGAGGGPTVSLVGITRGPNTLGVTSPIVTSANVNLGTLPGVYGDIGIFYSTAPETAFGTYTGAAQSLKNNSGDIVGLRTRLQNPLNLWDAWQLAAYGINGTTNPSYPSSPLIDSNGRGYAPWGLANVVAGPQSGYAWEFDFAKYTTCDPTPTTSPLANCIDQATQDVGPWQRIKYPGSQISDDPPGANPAVQPYTRGAGASNVGFDLTTGDLPPTVSQTDSTSPKAIRWAYGQLTYLQPEFAWVKVKVLDYNAILDPSGCPIWNVDTFGGDAGGDSGGKDHIWRYYDPNSLTANGCIAVGKPATRDFVKVGDTYQYKIKFYNAGNIALSNVVVKDTLPSGVTFISAAPAQNSGPNPLVWNVGSMLPGQKFETTVTVKATSKGALVNSLTVTGDPPTGPPLTVTVNEETIAGNIAFLVQSKSVTPSSVAPGGTVQYTIYVNNLGTGVTGSPVQISEYLPAGFTYVSKDSVLVNGADVTAATTVNASNPNRPIFSVPTGINASQSMALTFTAQVGANVVAGSYCNSFTTTQNSTPLTTGSQACVAVGGGRIGDTIFRDWYSNGIQDPGEEGLAGVTVQLNGGATTVTDANGYYEFNGLTAGNYTVDVISGVPSGYTLTTANDPTNVTLAENEQRLNVDFGYYPGGAGSIGDKLFEDVDNNGLFNGSDVGIDGVTINLYEDTNGNGAIDAGQDLLIATTTTSGGGNYSFTNLDPTRSYVVAAVDGVGSAVDAYFANPYLISTANPQSVTPADFTAQSNTATDADFGYFGQTPGSIGDTVCLDANSNGLCEPGEQGVPNITVKLYHDSNGDGVADPGELVTTTSTNITGTYTFGNLAPGNYLIVVDSADPDIPGGYFPSISQQGVTLAVGQNYLLADFPLVPLISKQVDKAQANPGDILNYTIVVNYPGSTLLNNVVVTDVIPAGTTYAGNDSPPATSEPTIGGTGTVQWNLGTNTAGTPGSTVGTPGSGIVNALATDDSWLDNGNATTNYGSATVMRVDGSGGGAGNGRAVLKFNLTGVLPGATVTGATLRLTQVNAQGTGARTFGLYQLTTNWSEGTVAWNTPWGSNGGDFNATALATQSVSTNGSYSWSSAALTTLVNNWVSGATVNFGILIGDDDGGGVWKEFATSEAASGQPVLEITYSGGTPLPSTHTALSAAPTLVSTGASISIKMVLTASTTVNSVTPGTLSVVNQTGGANASCGGPSPASASVGPAGTTFSYICTASAGASPGSIAFRTNATNGSVTWANATSNSVLVAPPLTFQVTVNNPATVGVVVNSANIRDASVIQSTPSNAAATTLGASIGDRVWADLNGDGVQNPGEPGLSGVQVIVNGPGCSPCTAVTNASGNYLIGGLAAGSYTVTYNPATIPAGYTATTPSTLNVTLTSAQQLTTADFGLRPPGASSIGDTVWLDANENGIVDAGESGLPNVTVRLYNSTGATLLATTTTDANGNYTFSGLHAASYQVQVDASSPVTSPFGVVSTIGAAMDLVSGTNPHQVVNLLDNQAYTSADFGYNWGGSIGDYAWYDNNGNQLQDGGELPAPGATTVLYYDLNGDGVYQSGEPILAVDETDAAGAYLFDNLPPGNYVVEVSEQEVPAPPSSPNAGQIGVMVATTGTQVGLTLAPNQDVTTVDWGFIEAALLEGHLFHDVNHNGVLDAGEALLSGVTVTLTGVDVNNNPVSLSTTTNAAGEYDFIVPPGDYTITYNAGDIPSALSEPTTPTSISLTVSAGAEVTGLDFGVDNSGRVGDTVFLDANNNGSQNTGEVGLNGVTVELYNSAGTTLLATTATDANGKYDFAGLPDGNYVVKVLTATAPSGYTATTATQYTATVSSGGSDLDNDFGFVPPGPTYTIGGRVYDDQNNNGNDDAEPALAGVEVTVVCDSGAFVTVTDANGDWSVSGVEAGSVCNPLTVDPATLPNRAYVGTETPTTPFTVSGNTTGLDFGFNQQLGAISGAVCVGSGDGICQPGEAPLNNVDVTLRYAGVDGFLNTADDVVNTVQTAPDGSYSFANLLPGLYQIVETNPAGYVSLADRDGLNPDNITVALAVGQSITGRDFEDAAPLLLIDKDATTTSVLPGGQATYRIVVRNSGNVAATGVTVTDTLPAGFTYASSSVVQNLATRTSTSNPTVGASTPVWGVWSIQPGGAITVNLTVNVAGNVPTGVYNNTASAGATNHPTVVDDGAVAQDPNTPPNEDPVSDDDVTVLPLGAPSYAVSKILNTPDPVRIGDIVSFTIRITNTGSLTITELPLRDIYDVRYLLFDSATPAPVDPTDDGQLDWNDLTATFGQDLAPNAAFSVVVYFKAWHDTTLLGGGATTNSANGHDVLADPDGPGGVSPIPVPDPLPASDTVRVFAPTSVEVEALSASYDGARVLIVWQTANEVEALAFNILRQDETGAWTTLNSELIPAQKAGQATGAAYQFVDETVHTQAQYRYVLEIIPNDGDAAYSEIGTVFTGGQVYLPLIGQP